VLGLLRTGLPLQHAHTCRASKLTCAHAARMARMAHIHTDCTGCAQLSTDTRTHAGCEQRGPQPAGPRPAPGFSRRHAGAPRHHPHPGNLSKGHGAAGRRRGRARGGVLLPPGSHATAAQVRACMRAFTCVLVHAPVCVSVLVLS